MRRVAHRLLASFLVPLLLPLASGPGPALAQDLILVAAKSKARRTTTKAAPKTPAKTSPKSKKSDAKQQPDARAWTTGREGGFPFLQFGRGTEDVVISFACEPDAGLVRVVALAGKTGGRRGLRPGDGARIRLMSGTTRFELAGTAFASDAGAALYISGTTRIVPRLFALFKRSETMTVEVPGRTLGISLAGIAPRAEVFERACLGRR